MQFNHTVFGWLLLILMSTQIKEGEFSSRTTRAIFGPKGRIESFILNLIANTIDEVKTDNVVVDPFTVWTTMNILAQGSEGETLDEIKRFLKFPRSNKEKLLNLYKDYRNIFNINSQSIQLETSNMFLFDKKLSLKRNFVNMVKNRFGIDVQEVNFKNPNLLYDINKKVSIDTDNKINEILNTNDLTNSEMIATSAVFFRGDLQYPFNADYTKKEPFYNKDGRVIGEVNMMTQKGPYLYVNHKDLQSDLIEMPYGKENELCMMIIMPKKGVSFDSVLRKFEKIHIREIFESFSQAEKKHGNIELNVHFPRFTITSDLVINKLLNKLGLNYVFDPNSANFTHITSDRRAYLSRIIHKVRMDVTEKSIEFTGIDIGNRFGEDEEEKIPEHVYVNRPFMFLVAEVKSGLLLLGGSYVKPSVY